MAYVGHILDQGKIWVDKNGTQHPIAIMDGRYALNTYNYLKNGVHRQVNDYLRYLLSVPMPNGEIAFDAVERSADAEAEMMSAKPLEWLLNKPLLKALARRVEAYRRDVLGWEGSRVWIEPTDPDYPDPRTEFDGYQLPEFQVAPRVRVKDLPQAKTGDERIVFLVTQGDYDSYRVLRPFVGNRTAAHRFAQELGRYEPTEVGDVEEFEDDTAGGGGVREYPKPWTELIIRTVIEFDTAEVVDNQVITSITTLPQPKDVETVNQDGGQLGRLRHRRVVVETTGPEKLYSRMRTLHRNRVIETRKSVKES